MTTQDLILLRKIATMNKEQLQALNIRAYDSTTKGSAKYKWRDVDDPKLLLDLHIDVTWAMRHHHDPSWRGFVTMPSACTNNECPFYTGRSISFTFDMKGHDVQTTWCWDAEDSDGHDTGCEDHAWLTDEMKVLNRAY
jgi:hypothetical protein